MRELSRWRRVAALLTVGALTLAACGGEEAADEAADDASEETSETTSEETESEASESEAEPTESETESEASEGGGETGDLSGVAIGDVEFDVGVTEEACPEAVNPDNGCIYLGTLSDLTEGPFAALGVSITAAQEAFWARVNEEGGIGPFDVDVTEFVRDNKYNPEIHNQLYQEIKPDVLALAQTLGSPTTAAILDDMVANDVIGAPASWTSLWEYQLNLVESGNPYCVESMNGLDWSAENEGEIGTVLAVHYPGDYGEDGAAGAKLWAEENGAEFAAVEQTPAGLGGTPDAAVSQIVQQDPDVVIVTTSPTELAQIVGGAASQGYQGRFIGNGPAWNPALLQTPAAEALQGLFTQSGPWPSYGADTPAHQAMREALGDVAGNDGFTSGWMWSYPLLAALEQGVGNGDITRAGLIEAVGQLEAVDYEGGIPDEAGNFAGDPNEQYARVSYIAKPSTEADSGLETITVEGYRGATADGYEFDPEQPCYQVTELG